MSKFLFLILISLVFFILTPANVLGASTKPSKTSYTIAVYGDSMEDTMGENLEYLQAALKYRYPNLSFNFYNYGIGAQNVEQGLARFHSPFVYKTRNYPSIASLHPDIIILGSYAYNPFFPHNRDRHWITLTKLIKEAKATGANVYMLAEIAPLKKGFGSGPNGVNWPDWLAEQHVKNISELLENAVYLSLDHLKIPLINAYFPTQLSGKFGNKIYVDPNDNIHPSILGHQFMARLIASKLKLR